MVREKLEELSDDQLKELATKYSVSCPEQFTKSDRDFVIYALETFPEPDNNAVADYIDEAVPGNLIAFRCNGYRVKSAKIIKKSSAENKLLVETKYGKRFLMPYDDVVWVNTTGHWPRWVYNLLKGIGHELECETTNEKTETRSVQG